MTATDRSPGGPAPAGAATAFPAAELVADAVHAPSSHNTQPWAFAVRPDGLALHADRTRALPINDPDDRELTISCGAALHTLCVSARARGIEPRVGTFPEGDTDLLALLDLTESREATRDDEAALAAVRARRTVRAPFSDDRLSEGLVGRLGEAVAAEGAWLEPLDGEARGALAGLVAEGDRMQFADPRWRRELASWMHPPRRGEGLAVGPAAPVIRLVVRAVDLGRRTGARGVALIEHTPLVAVLGTATDTPADWLAAGRALQRALLTGVSEGVQASHLNQPCQLPALRPRLAGLLARGGSPQLVLRFGRPLGTTRGAPRRPVAAVLRDGAA